MADRFRGPARRPALLDFVAGASLAVGVLAGCTTEARENANLIRVAAGQAKVKAGQAAAVEVVADTACGTDPQVQLSAHEKNTAGQAVRVVEASVLVTVQKSAIPFLPDPACAALVVPATLGSTFVPQTAGEWRIQGIGKFGPAVPEATFSVE